jgi:pantothenate kinase
VTLDDLVDRARVLAESGRRRILGITGAPGAGKSTVAQALVDALDGAAVLVGMDGFHLANSELERLGRRGRKGAVDTFDAAGYAALLRRLRAADECVYAPLFRREIEEPIACAVPVHPEVPLVVTEGNYLLVWEPVRQLLDEVWYLNPPLEDRLDRLVRRHEAYGKSPAQAREWAYGSDQRNADLVASTRHLADLVIQLTG